MGPAAPGLRGCVHIRPSEMGWDQACRQEGEVNVKLGFTANSLKEGGRGLMDVRWKVVAHEQGSQPLDALELCCPAAWLVTHVP